MNHKNGLNEELLEGIDDTIQKFKLDLFLTVGIIFILIPLSIAFFIINENPPIGIHP